MKKETKGGFIYICLTKEGMRCPLQRNKKKLICYKETEGRGAFAIFQQGGFPEAPMEERLLPINTNLSLIIFIYTPPDSPPPFLKPVSDHVRGSARRSGPHFHEAEGGGGRLQSPRAPAPPS